MRTGFTKSGLSGLVLLICFALPLHAETPSNAGADATRIQLATLSKPQSTGPAEAATTNTLRTKPATNGAQLFAENCASCHGMNGRGTEGIPDLANGVWQYGDSDGELRASIKNGRNGLMPSFGTPLGNEGLEQVLNYVLSLSGRSTASTQTLQAGKQQFGIFCASCHGDSGTGTQTIGAPDLTDDYWLHGGNIANIRNVIRNGRAANMPAHGRQLSDDSITALISYTRSIAAPISLAEAPQQ
jgi:cbb3-type cytochrome c oxidase subunit III